MFSRTMPIISFSMEREKFLQAGVHCIQRVMLLVHHNGLQRASKSHRASRHILDFSYPCLGLLCSLHAHLHAPFKVLLHGKQASSSEVCRLVSDSLVHGAIVGITRSPA